MPEGAPNEVCHVIPADKIEKLPEGTVTRKANLQDYWRDQEDILVECKGQKLYTNIHLPLKYPDGASTWKDDPDHEKWQALTNLLTQRLERGVRTEVEKNFWDSEIVKGQDGRAQFCGGVLPALPSRLDRPDLQVSAGKKTIRKVGLGQQSGKEPDQANQGEATALHITLTQAVITKSQYFHQTIFGSAFNANEALFTGGKASFYKAQFPGVYASFNKAQFTGGDASFRGAQFTGGAASFSGAQFTGGAALFNQAWFKLSCDFENALFETQAKFVDTIFPPAKGSESAFRGTQFLGAVEFSRENIEQAKDEAGEILRPEHTLFPFNAFENANIKDQIILSGIGDSEAQKEFKRALASIDLACVADEHDEHVKNKRKKRESRLFAMEQGCKTLKNAMEKTSDKNRAQRYFKFELLARQRRPSTSWVVKKMTSLYGLVADYGGSITRPLLSLLVSWAIFAFIYGVNAHMIGVTQDNPWTSLWGPMDFSLTHIFRPLFVWSSSNSANEIGWLPLYKDALSGGGWLTIKVLATVQSLASITLLFLFGLATKRKFQIS